MNDEAPFPGRLTNLVPVYLINSLEMTVTVTGYEHHVDPHCGALKIYLFITFEDGTKARINPEEHAEINEKREAVRNFLKECKQPALKFLPLKPVSTPPTWPRSSLSVSSITSLTAVLPRLTAPSQALEGSTHEGQEHHVEADSAIDTPRQCENINCKSTIIEAEIALKKRGAELTQLQDDDRKHSDECREQEAHKHEWRLLKEHKTHCKEHWISSTPQQMHVRH
jgi:hypothetical protein